MHALYQLGSELASHRKNMHSSPSSDLQATVDPDLSSNLPWTSYIRLLLPYPQRKASYRTNEGVRVGFIHSTQLPS
jgi:hypothetical protein